ncbi:ACP S-malonyltransferase [Utexia brackfieldae]|uniref:ACP S-malonyltransferase n=1 Tax=Utexia brackfieldae TaxID=3074108 RepID=UPI00370D0448
MDRNHLQPVAFLFAGQGNPTIGMGADLWDSNSQSKVIWDCASDISGIDIRRICLKGPMNKLVHTLHQQIAITAINVTLFHLYREKRPEHEIFGVCGHSVGEYAALYAANVLTLEDLFRCIYFRAQLMDTLSQVNKGTMQVVKGIDHQRLVELIGQVNLPVDVSCDNSNRQQVIGGEPQALREMASYLMNNHILLTKLAVSGAWHTRLMQDGIERMRDFLATIEIQSPQHKLWMNVTGMTETLPEKIRDNLALHLTHTVQWRTSMNQLLVQASSSSLCLIEVSNKPYLRNLLSDFETFSPAMSLHCKDL